MDDEETQPLAALQQANAMLDARQRAEQELIDAREALRHSAEHLRFALAAGHLGDWSWDAQSDVVTLSARAAEIFGLAHDAVITWTQMRELLHPNDGERARLAVERSLECRTDYDIEYRVLQPAGPPTWVAAKGRGTYA